jgi:hypothetical protein
LTAARTLTLATFPLTIAGITSSTFFANGNVGIGTTSDSGFKLDVNGTARIQGRQSITADPSVTLQTSSVIQATTTNSNLVLAPNGTGSILASIPDGTATGGNARAANSVDLQMIRAAADQVAAGFYGVISGGIDNKIIIGNELASGYCVIGGGRANQTSFGRYNTVSGGQSNVAGNAVGREAATVVGGRSNTASGTGCVVGGESNNVGVNAANSVALGRLITITGDFSAGFGFNFSMSGGSSFGMTVGARSTAGATTLLGINGHAYLPSQLVHGTDYLAPVFEGTYQSSEILPKTTATLTSGQTSAITCGGTLIIPTGTNRIWNVEINTTAVVTAITGTATGVNIGDVYTETKKLAFKRINSTVSIVGSVDTLYVKSDGGMTTASVTAAAGASQSLALTFTAPTFAGGGSVSVRVLSKVDLVEIAY